jgi:hypothetical protein
MIGKGKQTRLARMSQSSAPKLFEMHRRVYTRIAMKRQTEGNKTRFMIIIAGPLVTGSI